LDTKTTALTDDDYGDDESKEEFIDPERQQAICGAGPGRKYDDDGQRIVGGIDANPNSWPFMVMCISIKHSVTILSNEFLKFL
jgi:hypothetical protein